MSGEPTIIVSSWADGLYVFEDGAVRRELQGAPADGMARDEDGVVLVVRGGREVWSMAPGDRWRRLGTSEVDLACSLKVHERVLAGSNDARVLELSDGVWVPLDGLQATPGRDRWYAGAAVIDGKLVGPPLGVRSMAATCDGAALLANIHVGGIPRSTDGGATWSPTIDIDADVHQVVAHASRPEIVLAASAVGLGVSRDGGASWSITAEGLFSSYCSAVATTEDWILISVSSDHFAPQGAVYRRRVDDDGPMQRLQGGGLPEWFDGIVETRCISVRGDCVAIADKTALYCSQDGGESWSKLAEGLQMPSGVLVC